MLIELFNRRKNNPGKIGISEILKGTEAGRMQSVGYMQVIPLISEISHDQFVSPNEINVSTAGYGSMVFDNSSDKLLLVPVHAGYVVKQAAQDHAMAHAGLVKWKSSKTYQTAMCIQQSQGGYIKSGKHKMIILPFTLREKALEMREKKDFRKLWDDISKFNSKMGAPTGGHLEFFLSKFKEELDQFIAEFEPIPRQVGAIILIDGEVVGVEKVPSYSYWSNVWPALIRECYGSLALEYQKGLGDNPPAPNVRVPLNEEVDNLEELRKALHQAMDAEYELAKEKVRGLIADEFNCTKEETLDEFSIQTVANDQLYGQVVFQENVVLYASLIVKNKWSKKTKWKAAKPFSI